MTGSTDRNTFYFYRGRVALYALLRALDIRPGDEVLLQAFTCLAVPSPIVGLGAKPVYTDIDVATYNLRVEQLEGRITPRTRAIIVQHTYGIPADMAAIVAVARKYRLAIIEDCCHVLGSKYRGVDVGCLGDAAFYSYEWGKPLVIGLGGTAVVHSEETLKRVESLYEEFIAPPLKNAIIINLQYLAHRVLRRPALFWMIRDLYRLLSKNRLFVGSFQREEFEGKLSDDYERRMAGSLRKRLVARLRSAQRVVSHREWLTVQYEDGLRQLGLACVARVPGTESVYLRYPLLARDKARVLAMAREWKVELGDWFASPIHPLKEDEWPCVDYEKGSCPVAEEVCRRVVTLPLYEAIGQSDLDRTLGFLRNVRDEGLI